jgi:hypothetical protein
MTKIAIIGGGLSGLTLASLLKAKADITLFEKARGVGGRMATRRTDLYAFDHGAQYFTARTSAFQAFLNPLIAQGLITRWTPHTAIFEGDKMTALKNWADDEPRYVANPGMNALVKYMADDFNVILNTRITGLARKQHWFLHDENGGTHGAFDWVIFTQPAPQTAELIPPDFKQRDLIQSTTMRPCFSLMLGLSKPLSLPFQAAFINNADLSWLALNATKPARDAQAPTVLVHSSAAYAAAQTDADRAAVTTHLLALTTKYVALDVQDITHQLLHFWRYAQNATPCALGFLSDDDLNIGVCGDWLCGGRVEGAYTSAFHLAHHLTPFLTA